MFRQSNKKDVDIHLAKAVMHKVPKCNCEFPSDEGGDAGAADEELSVLILLLLPALPRHLGPAALVQQPLDRQLQLGTQVTKNMQSIQNIGIWQMLMTLNIFNLQL